MNFDEMNHLIKERQAEVEKKIINSRDEKKLVRTRPRNPDEIKILDKLCIERWKKAEEEGKIIYLSKRKWFYGFD